MKMLSRVCADFKDRKGNVIYRIRPADRLVYKDDVPEEVQEDLLFRMLVEDGSIDVIETAAQKKAAELDPTAGALADGRKQTKTKADVKAGAEQKPVEDKPAGAEKK